MGKRATTRAAARRRRATLPGVETQKRRLPLVKSGPPAGGGEDEPPRPTWQWVGFGAVAIFTAWLPLSALAWLLSSRVRATLGGAAGAAPGRADVVAMIANIAALAVASVAGGYVVGRWGAQGVGVRQAALAGLATALVAGGLSWASYGLSLGQLVVVVVAVPMAALGGRAGLRRRSSGHGG
jgi:tRNA-(ms[2]io[6]A)-hydroxylase